MGESIYCYSYFSTAISLVWKGCAATFQVACGTTARQAVLQSTLPTEFPRVDFAAAPIGIFGKKVKDNTPLRAGDRVEVYRALLIDPKENRRRKAAAKQKKEAT